MLTSAVLKDFVEELIAGKTFTPPSEAVQRLAVARRRSSPRLLVADAKDASSDVDVARLVVEQLEAWLRDVDEHGEHAEFADDAAFLRKQLATWRKRDTGTETHAALLDPALPRELVTNLAPKWLPKAQATIWAALRKSNRLPAAIKKVKATPPWFAELIAAYVAAEISTIASSKRPESWQSKFTDVPAMLAELARLGSPPLFTPFALRAAEDATKRHGAA